jgi:hypothetical protein
MTVIGKVNEPPGQHDLAALSEKEKILLATMCAYTANLQITN